MFTTAQCQKPVTVGASGSHIVTTRLCVPEGKPLQESCGEVSWPPAPKMPLTCGTASFAPSRRSLLVSENDAAGGRFSYGFDGDDRQLHTLTAVGALVIWNLR